jgi:hypothetical protein
MQRWRGELPETENPAARNPSWLAADNAPPRDVEAMQFAGPSPPGARWGICRTDPAAIAGLR